MKTIRPNAMINLIIPSLLFLVLSQSGCSSDQQGADSSKMPPPQKLSAQVEVVIATDQPIRKTMMFSGRIDNRKHVEIRNPVAGELTEFKLVEGDEVKKEQVLAVIKNPITQSRLKKANFQLQQTQNNLRRLKSLSKSQAVSEEQLTTAQTDMDVAKATVNEIKIEIEQGTIRAPFNGIVTRKLVENGTYLSPYTAIISIADAENFTVVASVPTYQIRELQQGLKAKVITAGGEIRPIATLERVFPTIESNDNMATVEFLLPKERINHLSSGERVYLDLELPQRHAIAIPLRSVLADEKGSYLFIVNDQNVIEQRYVKTAELLNDGIIISQGLNDGESVVITGFSTIKAGSKVSIVKGTQL